MHSLSAHLQTGLLLLAIVVCFIWLNLPALQPYSLQLFALTVIIYFALKRLTKAKLWHLAPTAMSIEVVILTFAFLLLVGSTGGISSPVYPLTYIELFFLVFTSHPSTSIISLLFIMFFYYGLNPDLVLGQLSHLLALPIMVIFFLFAKHQYDELSYDRTLLNEEEHSLREISLKEHSLENFLQRILPEYLEKIQRLIQFPEQNRVLLEQYVTELQVLVEKQLKKITSKT